MAPVVPAPISATGLAAGHPFEAWVQLVDPASSRAHGLTMHRGDRIRITFPPAFAPRSGRPQAYLLYGWPQGDIDMQFRVMLAAHDPRTVDIAIDSGIRAVSPAAPGLKTIHLQAPLTNPRAGTYRLRVVATIDGATVSGSPAVRIGAAPVAQIAPYNALHDGANEDGLPVARGARLPMDIDFLVTDTDGTHPGGIAVETFGDRPNVATVMRDGNRIGAIAATPGVRLESVEAPADGVVRLRVTAPAQPGIATIRASLDGGSGTTLRLRVR